jgi:hypothetical protein
MRIQTILNRVEKCESFVYRGAVMEERDDGPALVVRLEPRKNSRPFCSNCGRRGSTYDRLEERRFEFVPIWGILVFLAYRMRRVDCAHCGIKVETVPWCDGKNQLTTTYRWYLATWAKRLSWSGVAAIFRTSWDSICRSVEHAVEWGLAHRDLSKITPAQVDEAAPGQQLEAQVVDLSGLGLSTILSGTQFAFGSPDSILRTCRMSGSPLAMDSRSAQPTSASERDNSPRSGSQTAVSMTTSVCGPSPG